MPPVLRLKIIAGPVAAVIVFFLVARTSGNIQAAKMAAVTAWVAWWWLSEAVHLAVASLLPLVLLPLLGILDAKAAASQYMDHIIFLFIGGFFLAFAIERWNLHHRIALKILMHVGSEPAQVLAGIMCATWFVSMWMSNTATTLMLLSAVLAVIKQTDTHYGIREKNHIATALLLGLCYAASIGGMATLVGTPTNMILLSFYNKMFPQSGTITFAGWMVTGVPISLLLLCAAYFILCRFHLHGIKSTFQTHYFADEYRKLGRMHYEEKVVSIIFLITALLWFFREDIVLGSIIFPGWSRLLGASASYVQDSTVAVCMALLLFLIPSKSEKERALITWEEASKIPLGIILLFGGGFVLARGFDVSGLSGLLASSLQGLKGAPPLLIMLGVCTLVCILSEFASNVASVQLVLPVLVSLAATLGINPLMLLIPATFAASLGFMLPVATAPNTIVFGSGRIRSKQMMRAGFFIDLAGVLLVTLGMYFIGTWWWKL